MIAVSKTGIAGGEDLLAGADNGVAVVVVAIVIVRIDA